MKSVKNKVIAIGVQSLFVFFLCTCSDRAEVLDSPDLSAIRNSGLTIAIDKDSISADGESVGKLLISTKSPALRNGTVTVKISPIGEFATGGQSTITLFSNTGELTVFIRSLTSGKSYVTASAGGINVTKEVKFYEPKILLTLESDSVLADGATIIKATVATNENALYGKKALFKIDPYGKVENQLKADSDTVTVRLSSTGEATAFISSVETGISRVHVSLAGRTLTKLIKFYTAPSPFTFNTSGNVPADNYTQATITVSGAVKNFQGKNVTFVTDRGTFSNGSPTYTTQASFDGTAVAYLKSSKPETARVTITLLQNITKEQTITFDPAYPAQIIVEPGVSQLAPALNSKTSVTAKLLRTAGSVSDGNIVQFYDSTQNNTHIGSFFNVTTSSSGTASAEYSLQDDSFTGFVYIKAYVALPGGKKVLGVNRILIK